ncbi:hypothetical protein QJS04_geneDACA019292 [Acorus gramineus]|uniref:Uncharacterized protein n=1 Tax=Acorus gramineus TaxID=55184 RepID=A0AAV9A3I3_ACOGR|nr:hypothetical protein QJS04_geneDACA019292 [Acorus gramineus]
MVFGLSQVREGLNPMTKNSNLNLPKHRVGSGSTHPSCSPIGKSVETGLFEILNRLSSSTDLGRCRLISRTLRSLTPTVRSVRFLCYRARYLHS